jgi:hypothetical protein
MTILLSTLAVAFAAFCVWLVVRIVNRKELWAKWTAALLVAGMTIVGAWCAMIYFLARSILTSSAQDSRAAAHLAVASMVVFYVTLGKQLETSLTT